MNNYLELLYLISFTGILAVAYSYLLSGQIISSNAGNCCEEHVGVNAPGSENINTLLSAKRSVDDIVIHALSSSR